MTRVNNNALKKYGDNLETFSLFWLDTQVNTTDDNIKTQQKLRRIINHLKTFDNEQKCQQQIKSLSKQDRLVLIVSGRLGRQIIPQIHKLPQLSSIYVYCMDKEENDKWTKDYNKVKNVIVKRDDLIAQIKLDQKRRVKTEEPFSFNIFAIGDNLGQSTTGLNGQFVHFLLLIDILLRMKPSQSDKKQFINICKNEYAGNDKQLVIIEEFEKNYGESNPVWWYTRDSFFYNILNKALQTQNISLLYLLRSFIGDIYKQLNLYQCETLICVYRGQMISTEELDKLQHSINNFIAINSFFSTSVDRQKALSFMKSVKASMDLHQLLFIIDADPRVITNKPFANLKLISSYDNEEEILFMAGCIFRLIEIHRHEEYWTIRMQLCNDEKHELRDLFQRMKKDYTGDGKKDSRHSFGIVVQQMGEYDVAERMYRRLLNEYPSNHPSTSNLYYALGTVMNDKGDYNSSLQCFHKSLNIKMKTNDSDLKRIGYLHNLIGVIYWRKGDGHTALEYYKKAIELYQRAHAGSHSDMGDIYNNIAMTYNDRKNFSTALRFYEKSLVIRGNTLPVGHPRIAASHNNIGALHFQLNQNDLAEKHYNESLKIGVKSLPPQHPDLAMNYRNIGLVNEAKHNWKQALIFFQEAARIFHHSLLSQHPDVIKIRQDIHRVRLKL